MIDALTTADKQQAGVLVDILMHHLNDKNFSEYIMGLCHQDQRCISGVASALSAGKAYDANKLIDSGEAGRAAAERVETMFANLDSITALFPPLKSEEAPREILDMVNERQQARRGRDFAKADDLRDKLKEMGWVIEDTPDGARVKAL